MTKAKTLGLVIALVAFVGGWQLGQNSDSTPQITSSIGGASYSGGGDADRINTALPERIAIGETITVNPGDSIQAAVEAAQPGDTIQVMPGIYSETVYID
jgi:hypothetical protein